jgi:hypothetical protein
MNQFYNSMPETPQQAAKRQQLAAMLQQQMILPDQNVQMPANTPASTTDQFKQMGMDWLRSQLKPGAQNANLGGFPSEGNTTNIG